MVIMALSSCAQLTPPPKAPAQADHRLVRLPDLPGYPDPIAAVQAIHVDRAGQRADVQAVIELRPDLLVMVVAHPAGPRLATIAWSADGVRVERGAVLPAAAALQPEDVLADLMLAFWPEAMVRRNLGDGLLLVVDPGRRQVVRDGVVLVDIHRNDADPWNHQTRLDRRDLGYKLTIDSMAGGGT